MLIGGDLVIVIPDHELTIVNDTVVEDLEPGVNGRTYDACIPGNNQGNPNGAWAFKTLWMAAVKAKSVPAAEQALDDFLFNWANPNLIVPPSDGFQVLPRPNIGTLASSPSNNGTYFLANWPVDKNNMCTEPPPFGTTYCPSLVAPVRLNAIVNRVDLAGQPNQTQAGELRFVFGVTSGTDHTCSTQGPPSGSAPAFNIIFEYHVPSTYTADSWAQQWNMLPTDPNFGFNYVPQLQSLITNNVVTAISCTDTNGNPNTCLFHIRTNEIILSGPPSGSPAIWELREFGINYGANGANNTISEIAVDQTPSNTFNFGGAPCYQHGAPTGQPGCNTTDADAMADCWAQATGPFCRLFVRMSVCTDRHSESTPRLASTFGTSLGGEARLDAEQKFRFN